MHGGPEIRSEKLSDTSGTQSIHLYRGFLTSSLEVACFDVLSFLQAHKKQFVRSGKTMTAATAGKPPKTPA